MVVVVETFDIVLAEIAAGLYRDPLQIDLAEFQAGASRADWECRSNGFLDDYDVVTNGAPRLLREVLRRLIPIAIYFDLPIKSPATIPTVA